MSTQVDDVKTEGAAVSSPATRRMRTTIVVEYESQEDLNEALEHGLQCAREQFVGIKFRLKVKEKGEHGPTIEVRTARCRRKPTP